MAEKRLAYLTSQYPATSHTFISREVAALRRSGRQIDTFSIRPPSADELKDEDLAREAQTTFTVLRQPWTRFISAHAGAFLNRPARYLQTFGLALCHRPPGLRGLALAIAHFGEAVLLSQQLRRRNSARLHNHFANSAATVGYLATKLLDLPWSFTMHGISETDYPAGLMLGRKIEAAEFVACVSYFGRAQAMRLVSPIHWPKLRIVRCGLALADMPRADRSPGPTRFICVGRLSPEKGQSGLLEAFATLTREHSAIELVFVGDGPLSAELQARAKQLEIADRVTFTGRLGEQATLKQIARADVLVLPSFMEGLPIVLMEAMAIGVPVIATRVAGIPELVDEGANGLLFTPSNWDELASCMSRLATDKDLCASLAAAAQTAVRREFDIECSVRDLNALFEGKDAK